MVKSNHAVLLIGPNFHDFNRFVSSALERLGRKVVVESYDTPISPYTRWNKVAYKVAGDKEGMRDKSRKCFSAQAVGTFDKVRPQVVFLLNGEMLTPDAVQHFRKSAMVVAWLYDSITRVSQCWNIVPFCHKVFCYEQEDIRLISSLRQWTPRLILISLTSKRSGTLFLLPICGSRLNVCD